MALDVRAPRLIVVEHEADAGLGHFTEPLAAAGLDLDVRRPYARDVLPTTLDGADGLLVLGGEMAAWEDERAPWLPATRALLAEGTAQGVPTLGICLGAQLLALALGGGVERGAAGPELGVRTVRLRPEAATDPLLGALGPVGGQVAAAQGHGDALTRLPDGAVWLAEGDAYPYQAFRVGRCAWGVQWHPEVTAADFAAWLAHEAPRSGFDLAAELADHQERAPELAQVWRPFAERFAGVVAAGVLAA